jgi:hypothetical protein
MSGTIALDRQPIDLSVYARVAAHEARLQKDVVRLDCGWAGRLPLPGACGVKSRLDADGGLQLEVRIVVRYGTDARAVGAAVQEAVRRGVGRISDRPVNCVHVVIRGFEFGRPERPLYERSATA